MTEEFGTYLKYERELRGISLEEVSARTKINVCYLNALEKDKLEGLPGEVFIRGYIRSYAKSIGADEEEILIAYDDTIGKPRKEEFEKTIRTKENSEQKIQKIKGSVLAGFLAAGLVGAGIWGGMGGISDLKLNFSNFVKSSDNLSAPGQAAQSRNSVNQKINGQISFNKTEATGFFPALKPVNYKEINELFMVSEEIVSGVMDPDSGQALARAGSESNEKSKDAEELGKNKTLAGIEAQPDRVKESPVKLGENDDTIQANPEKNKVERQPLELVIRARESSWFNLKVDSSKEEDFILSAGTRKKIHAEGSIKVWIGNGPGTELTLNGRALKMPESSDNVIRDFVINAKLLE